MSAWSSQAAGGRVGPARSQGRACARRCVAPPRAGPPPPPPPPRTSSNPLAAAVDLARARSTHPSLCPADPYAELLVKAAHCEKEESPPPPPPSSLPTSPALDAAATAWIDTHALRAVDLVNLDVRADGVEYRQVLLISPGLDTRPFRLPWPEGGALQFFELAPADCLAVSAAALKGAGVAVRRGCLLRGVVADVAAGDGAWVEGLAAAGFRGDRLSIVCFQAGTPGWGGLDRPALRTALAAAARSSARGSFVFGDLPAWVGSRDQAADLLAEAGLLVGALERPGESEEGSAGGWAEAGWVGGSGVPTTADDRWFFAAQQQGRSDAELDILDQAEWAVDEDFDGHFS